MNIIARKRKYIVGIILLVIASTISSGIAYAYSAERILESIEKCKRLAKQGGLQTDDFNKNWVNMQMTSNYAVFANDPVYFRNLGGMDIKELEALYNEWEADKTLIVLRELITFKNILKENGMNNLEAKRFFEIVEGIKSYCSKALSSNNLDVGALNSIHWRLRFISSYGGVDKLISDAVYRLEYESIKSDLRDSYATGNPNYNVEARVGKLTDKDRREIEILRNELEREQSAKLAFVKEEADKQEKTLARKKEVDEAIVLRKKEIDTGVSDAKLTKWLEADKGLKESVNLWEKKYRIDVARKRGRDAAIKLKEIEVAKEKAKRDKDLLEAEEFREKEAELNEQKKKNRQNRINAKLIKYNVMREVTIYDLNANPFIYEGKNIIVTVQFIKMIDRSIGLFSFGGKEVVIKKLPTDMFAEQGLLSRLIGRGRGTLEVENGFGIKYKLPLIEFLDVID